MGCSSALPTSERFSTAQVLQMLGRYFLIDCGEGTQMQLRKAKSPFSKINNIFISHLHGDHYFGIFGLLSTFSMLGRKHPLHIFGPSLLEEIVTDQLKHFRDDISYQLVFHHTNPEHGLEVLYEDKRLIVSSFPLKHRTPTTGFLFQEKTKEPNIRKDAIAKYNLSLKEILAIKSGADLHIDESTIILNEDLVIAAPLPKSFAFCSDTAFSGNTINFVKNVSLLYHESTFADDMLVRAKQTMHSTAKQAAEVAKQANVQKLILGHYSARYADTQIFLDEASSIFQNTVLGNDLGEYDF